MCKMRISEKLKVIHSAADAKMVSEKNDDETKGRPTPSAAPSPPFPSRPLFPCPKNSWRRRPQDIVKPRDKHRERERERERGRLVSLSSRRSRRRRRRRSGGGKPTVRNMTPSCFKMVVKFPEVAPPVGRSVGRMGVSQWNLKGRLSLSRSFALWRCGSHGDIKTLYGNDDRRPRRSCWRRGTTRVCVWRPFPEFMKP